MLTDTEGRRAKEYRPYLDGLRTIAVYLVVLFHAAPKYLPGGFVGVDVFFVLSGYLVTQVLLRDIAGQGSIRFGRFYARRFRRLAPAAFVALLSTAAVYTALASPSETLDALSSFKAAFLYSANWYFIQQSSSYFGIDASTNPVLQYWSLAVEEQFYVLWPLALAALFALTRGRGDRQSATLRLVVAGAALLSVARALWLRAGEPGWAYYGTDARAYQLLAGAYLALAPALVASVSRFHRPIRIGAGISVLAMLVLALPLGAVDAIVRGIAVTLVTCVLILALEAAKGGIVHRLLSSGFMVYLGKISYGTYLWHWPVLMVAARALHLDTRSTVVVAVIFSTALASLSAGLLEMPVRESRLLDRHSRIVVFGGLATSIFAALVLIPAIMNPSAAVSAGPLSQIASVGTTLRPADLDWQHARWTAPHFQQCMDKPIEECTVVQGGGRHILLIGDSHAQAWLPTFTEIARRENLSLSASMWGACPWQRDLFRTGGTFSGVAIRPEECKKYKDDLYDRVIPQMHPDVIVLAQFPYEDPDQELPFLDSDLRPLKADTAEQYKAALQQATSSTLASLRSAGRDVLVIEPIPIVSRSGRDPLVCISGAKTLEECRYVVSTAVSPLEEVYRSLAKQDPRIRSADFDRLVCPYFPICDPVVNGQIVKWDKSHLTTKFAVSLVDPIDAYLKSAGLIPIRADGALAPPPASAPVVDPLRAEKRKLLERP